MTLFKCTQIKISLIQILFNQKYNKKEILFLKSQIML